MKKLFISVPMKGRTKEAICNSIKRMHAIAEAVFDEKLEVIDSYVDVEPPKDTREQIWYLGQSITKMAEADYFIGFDVWEHFNGCFIERSVASAYDIPLYTLEMRRLDFMQDVISMNEAACPRYIG